MNSNVLRGSLDGSYIPHGNKKHVMVTRYNNEDDATPEVYTWNVGAGCWWHDHAATCEATHGMTTHGNNPNQTISDLQDTNEGLEENVRRLEEEADDLRYELRDAQDDLAEAVKEKPDDRSK